MFISLFYNLLIVLKKGIYIRLVLLILLLSGNYASAQPVIESNLTVSEIEEYEQQVRGLVSFFQFMCNAIGDSYSTPKEKDIVITQTYLKAFRDGEVQVEDDLVDNRRTVTNKNIQAYFKDIDFFFTEARFDFHVESIEHYLTEDGTFYFRVHTHRNLQAITVEGDTINAAKPRFIEINLNEEERDLKIVSIYTTKMSEAEALTNWWNELSSDWQYFLGHSLVVGDSMTVRQMMEQYGSARLRDTILLPIQAMGTGITQVSDLEAPSQALTRYDTLFVKKQNLYPQLLALVEQEDLSIAGEPTLMDLSAVARLTNLRRLNISGTGVSDLQALRNLTRLESFDCSGTPVGSIAALRYATQLRQLNCANTRLNSLSAAENFTRLEKIDVSGSPISDLAPLTGIQSLREAHLAGTDIRDLSPLAGKKALTHLDISNTQVVDIQPLADLINLRTLNIEGIQVANIAPLSTALSLSRLLMDRTPVRELIPLVGLAQLKYVYGDETGISAETALAFAEQRPDVLVVYQTGRLENWWAGLMEPWREVLMRYLDPGAALTREALQELANLRSIDIQGLTEITDLEPLRVMARLQELHCNYTAIRSLAPLAELNQLTLIESAHTPLADLLPLMDLDRLRVLDIQYTAVTDLTPLSHVSTLERLNCEHTEVSSLMPLVALEQLDTIYCDNSNVNIAEARQFLSQALVIFQTSELEKWWNALPLAWQRVFREHVRTNPQPSAAQLNAIAGLNMLNISGNREISDLSPVERLYRLEQLLIEDTRITSLMPVSRLSTLKVLKCARSPVYDLTPLKFHTGLRELNIENTPVDDIEPLSYLKEMEELICGGTQIKDLRPIEGMYKLRKLDISNTSVRNLNSLEGLIAMEYLECFNTRVSARQVDKIREMMPALNIVYY